MNIINFKKNKITKKYEDYIILGENCEVSWQYTRNLGDIESDLFNWAYVYDKDKFLQALENIDIVTKDKIRIDYNRVMYQCENCGCLFHGLKATHQLIDSNGDFITELLNQEITDLRSRNIYLIEKFKRLYTSNSTKLFIYKTQNLNDSNIEKYQEFALNLYTTINKISTNASILFIIKKKYYEDFKFLEEKPNIFVRCLKNYTDIHDSCNAKVSDNKGWTAIYKEFSPTKIKKRRKKYKFDENKQINKLKNFIKKNYPELFQKLKEIKAKLFS